MGSSGNDRPQNITLPVGSMTALMATWGISKGPRIQRPTSLAGPVLSLASANCSASRRSCAAICRRSLGDKPLQLARLVGLGGSPVGVFGGVLRAQERVLHGVDPRL